MVHKTMVIILDVLWCQIYTSWQILVGLCGNIFHIKHIIINNISPRCDNSKLLCDVTDFNDLKHFNDTTN